MDPLLVTVISAVVSVTVGVVGVLVAKSKGLPGINKEIEERMQTLVATLRSEIDAKGRDFDACKVQLVDARARIKSLEDQAEQDRRLIDRLFRRLDDAKIGLEGPDVRKSS